METSCNTRRTALSKLAALSVAASAGPAASSDLERLHGLVGRAPKSQSPSKSVSSIPMSYRELEILLALSKAAPLVLDEGSAGNLLRRLSPYLLEIHSQAFSPSPFLHSIHPSPWEALSSNLSSALLSIGSRIPSLRQSALEPISTFLEQTRRDAQATTAEIISDGQRSPVVEDRDSSRIVTITVTLIGFLKAAAEHTDIWTTSEQIKLIEELEEIISDQFLTSLETALSTIRNSHSADPLIRDWKRHVRHYAAIGEPLGAMLVQRGFMKLALRVATGYITISKYHSEKELLNHLMLHPESSRLPASPTRDAHAPEVEKLAELASRQMTLLDDGADFLQLGSAWQQRLAFAVKATALATFMACTLLDPELASAETLLSWLEDTINDSVQMSDERLATVVLQCMAILAKVTSEDAAPICRSLLRYVVRSTAQGEIMAVLVQSLSSSLQCLSQDATITTLYTLGNALSASSDEKLTTGGVTPNGSVKANGHMPQYGGERTGSAISLALSAEDSTVVYVNIIRAIVGITRGCKDEKIAALAQSMLIQKIGKISAAVDACIISQTAVLALLGGVSELRSLLRLYSKICHDSVIRRDDLLCNAILEARTYLSSNLPLDSPLYIFYFVHLLELVVSKGDVQSHGDNHHLDLELAAREIGQLLPPLAAFMSRADLVHDAIVGDDILSLARDAWFNIVIHGYTTSSGSHARYGVELRSLALHFRPLVMDDGLNPLEDDLDLNTVLRRGMTIPRTVEQKKALASLLPNHEPYSKGLSYPRLIFLRATYVMETIRAESGDCATILPYLVNETLATGYMGKCMEGISAAVTDICIRKSLEANDHIFSASNMAKQLAAIFVCCCHRIEEVQIVATTAADRMIKATPSALCQRSSLFALLELLSLVWRSCLDEEKDEYQWTSSFTSSKGGITLHLSDNYTLRRRTLNSLYEKAKEWVTRAINVAPLTVKGLLQTYLSDYVEDGLFGHISLGRSFALDMGCIVPDTDQRLSAIDRHGDCNINTASDFVAQYTRRQGYRTAEALSGLEGLTNSSLRPENLITSRPEAAPNDTSESIEAALAKLEAQVHRKTAIPDEILCKILQRAAASLCRPSLATSTIAHQLVHIPFAIFTKRAITLGISLWLGVINENPELETRLLVEIAEHWQVTVRQRMGMFDPKLHHPDPFYLKELFAPSDKEVISKRRQGALRLIEPHLKLIHFLGSHFNASRLGNVHTQKVFQRLTEVTLSELRHSIGHPLAREVHFQVILFALNILRFSNGMDAWARWKLKDQILSAALNWFAFAARWSYGGNRLQVKAETHVLANLESALQSTAHIGSKPWGPHKSSIQKQDLLLTLIHNEQNRLIVWLFPLDHESRFHFAANHSKSAPSDIMLSTYLNVAWEESAALAIQLVSRFNYPALTSELRALLLRSPERAIGDPDALPILLGTSLPDDVFSQLRYLLYWAPVDPITAVNYFLPSYKQHPFILQYAMRALETHPIDVTFFYVPQIVQSLRYDALGYVERYIIETAKFSPLFAHQIIWNMKANAYKDEDSQIPDPIKPELDKVMQSMISSFSASDLSFYEREFAFFAEITGISGKLRPYIKSSKAEKKQKIEEELRKIKVDVGVYLPSNPTGIVIGIDRTSGKPLQSHAKAPYMATFRIRKNKGSQSEVEEMLEQIHQDEGSSKQENTIDVWQAAIFKVGDDCRQDVLALQMIAAFRGIFEHVGLDVYVFPYQVTATAPGCGVIDVLPNSISRDMLGREAVNGLYDYFVSKYGGERSIRFQEARTNFVKSMAAYSVISYLLQFKDRHNGNIMIDDAGHILHIDFGFCFDIAPGGIRFERAPFKLTSEMVAVMGGGQGGQSHLDSQPYRWFEELCVKSFLACRPHTEQLINIVRPMLDSGLPCFKPDTIQHFRDRFVLYKSEREAADFMRDLIKKSRGSYSTKGYDQFQLMTNGIPY